KIRGLCSEFLVARAAWSERGWRLRAHRLRTPFAEIDLIFETPERQLHAVEVKSLGPLGLLEFRVSLRQRARLLGVREWLEVRSGAPTSMDLAVVSHEDEIHWFPDFLS
ncbi:MAG: YraN family protein, partial [Bdellovibrionaceae bacterium]|nr:YraN family protein [Pseudobdellovibrionaceae bacterium]